MGPEELRADIELSLGRGRFSRRRLELLSKLTEIYEEERVLKQGYAPPLWRDCPAADSCWKGAPDLQKPGFAERDTELGGMPLPWVGRLYKPGGIVVVAINLNNASGFYVEYEIAWTQLRTLESGGRAPHLSALAYGSMQAAAAVLRSMMGEAELRVDDPPTLAQVLDRTARLQSIKCSPHAPRSPRHSAMKRHCPSRYLRRELGVLAPSVVIALGDEAWDALERIGDIDQSVEGDHYSRSRVEVDDVNFRMVWLHHPSGNKSRWRESYNLLLSDLQRHPIRSEHSR